MPSTPRRLARRYVPVRVRRAILELTRGESGPAKAQPAAKKASGTGPKSAAPKKAAAAASHNETLLVRLEHGYDVDSAIVAQIQALLSAKEYDRAVSVAESLRETDASRVIGDLASALVSFHRGYLELAWQRFGSVSRDLWAVYAPQEYVRSGLFVVGDSVLEEVRQLLADDPKTVGAQSWYRILETVFGLGDGNLAREVFETFDRHVRDDEPWDRAEQLRDWMRPWVQSNPDSPTAPRPAEGRRTFAVMDYGHPGINRGSANIGDHVQTIASLGHLVRHQGVRLHGREDLVDLLKQLGGRVRPERQRHQVDTDIDVITVHRDASMYEAIPEDTWILCFGWFMHALFEMRYGFPLHKNLRPIFVSFHCNKRELLTPEAIGYLKQYGPIGCRDWTTVYLLTSLGVPAFFSGCLTTTIDTVFPDLIAKPAQDAPVAYVDVPPAQVPKGGVTYRHSNKEVRVRSFITNVYSALDLLETYRRKHGGVVTSRLHCYLPVRSLGMGVDFQPGNRSDIRFDGLIDITEDAFMAIRDGVLGKLEQVFTAILSGNSEQEVYDLWRQITADDVTAAQERLHAESTLAVVAADITNETSRVVAQTVTIDASQLLDGDPVHLAVSLSKGRELAASVLLSSIVASASRPLHVWMLARELSDSTERALAAKFPQVTFSLVPTHGLAANVRPITGQPASPEGLDRLLLPLLLSGVDRVLVVPIDAVVTSDIAELYDLDLGEHAFAAPTTVGRSGASGFGVIHSAALRLQHRTQAAGALRRTAHARHEFDFDSYSDSVLVVQLDRWRSEGFVDQALPLVEAYGLNAREVLHYLAGPDRAVVPPQWAAVPTRSSAGQRGLLHWADRVKPWHGAFTPEKRRWQQFAAAVRS